MIMPPGVSAADWKRVLEGFRAAVGDQWVFTSDEDVALYRDAYSPYWDEKDERMASAAVAPATVEQVQAVVRIANQFSVPLFSISTGKNVGYGGSAPNLSGSVVVDLKRMNKVIEVDDKRYFATVEPGVSYFDLYRHIQDRKLNVWIDCPDPGWGSVLGNSLERGVGHTWLFYRDHFLSHSGMEIVLPNGELMRTGMGAMPGSTTSSEFRYGFGPYVDGLFSQGGFGIVTKMGFHLMPAPETVARKQVTAFRKKDIIPLVELFNEFEYSGLIGMPIYESPMNHHQFADPELMKLGQAADAFTSDALDRYAQSKKIGRWAISFAIYGPGQGVEANWQWMKARLLKAVPDLKIEDLELLHFPLDAAQTEAVQHKVVVGIPNMNVFSLGARSQINPEPFDGHLLFSPIIPKTGESVLHAQELFGTMMRQMGIVTPFTYGPFSTPYTWMPRAFAFATGLPVSRSDKAVNERSRDLMRKMIAVGAENGFGEYRTPPIFQDQVMGTYSFNDNMLRRFCETLKDAVDPKGIIAPGRGGFWPKRFRGAVQ